MGHARTANCRIDRGDRAPKDPRGHANGPITGNHLQMHARSGPQGALTLDEGAARTEVDQRDGSAGSQHGAHRRDDVLTKATIPSPFVHLLIHCRFPGW